MIDNSEKRKIAIELRKSKNYLKAAEIYNELWSNIPNRDKWDGWGLVYSLNQLKDYTRAYVVSKEVFVMDNEFEYNVSQFSWSSYMSNIKNYDVTAPTDILEVYVTEVADVTARKEEDIFRNQSILKIMEHLILKGNWQRVIEWSKLIKSENLKITDYKGVSADGKKYRKPSDRESYFLKITKAFERTEQYEICIKFCDEALKLFPEEVWFKWHKGVSFRKLKQYEKAITILEEVKLRKKDWFILKDLAAAYYGIKNYDQALINFLEGAISSVKIPSPENRWELYYIGAKLFEKRDNIELAKIHLELVYKLHIENGWKVKEFIQKNVDSSLLTPEKSSQEYIYKLNKIWITEQQLILPKGIGLIKKILPNNLAGYITSSTGKDYYFRIRSIVSGKPTDIIDKKVEFNINKSFDKVKNRESEEAVNITIIK